MCVIEERLEMATQKTAQAIQTISVIVPANPFIRENGEVKHCLAALDVTKLMEWWPGTPHAPHRKPDKVRAIQRSLDWKRVAQIAAYLLQREIVDAPGRVVQYFDEVYGARAGEPGREWPPRLPSVAKFQRSAYPTFSNVLLHVNGATIEDVSSGSSSAQGATAKLVFNEDDADLNFSVIDGQHRINGAYLAVRIRQEEHPDDTWQIPSEIFLNLDPPNAAPRRQAQIFIDVNAYQKKVDRSLVADLFPTARGKRDPLDDKERAQDIGRRLMLETGPLVGMIQIPGIRYGVKDVVTLATLNAAVEDILDDLHKARIMSLDAQTEFLAVCLNAWLEAAGRKEDVTGDAELSTENVAYQGRAIVSFLTLVPACILELQKTPKTLFVSDAASESLANFLRNTMKRAGLLSRGKFLSKAEFKEKGYLGSGGLARFRDCMWAAVGGTKITTGMSAERVAKYASESRASVRKELESAHEH
jgi:DGQHR domain-containing protein